MSGTALRDFRVLDLSESIGGQYCARLFADYGADVLLLEPPGGSAIRTAPPLSADNNTGSWLFFHLNTGKRSAVLDSTGDAGRAALFARCMTADVILLPAGFDRACLDEIAPQAVTVSIQDFDATGPRAGWKATEMVIQALSGMMVNNGAAGREPLYGCGQRTAFAAGLAAYVGTVTALLARPALGRGQHVDIDVNEVAATMAFPYVMQFLYSGYDRVRADQVIPAGQVLCRDGWVCIWLYNNRWTQLCTTLDLPELLVDTRFATPAARRDHWTALFAIIQARVADCNAEELVDQLQRADIIAAKSVRPAELGRQRHLIERQFWQALPDGRAALGAPWLFSRTPRGPLRPPPATPGDGPAAPASAPARPAQVPASPPAPPLAGLRIVEMTTAWAGPMAGRILAYFGAESITIESPNRVNTWRLNRDAPLPENFPDRTPGARHYDRSFLFNSQNVNKRSCLLDLKKPRARAILMQLLAQSDVLISNFRPGTLEKLGIGHADLKAINPRIIVAELPAFGRTGPMARHAALGPTMEMAAGMSSLVGYPGGQPEVTGPSYLDPIGGYNTAAAILTALLHRQRTGEGQHVEVPQVEAAMQFIGAEILAACESGRDPERNGNRIAHAVPHEAFPAAGTDQWITIEARDPHEWQALCRAISQPGLASDPRFADLASRRHNEAALNAILAGWTRTRDKQATAALLQAAGVPSAPVQTPREIAGDPHLAHRGFFTPLTHPDAGRHPHPGLALHLSATPGGQHRAAPTFGGDNAYVLGTLLGMGAEAVEAAARDGLIADTPVPGA